jgi:hypothetical protein
VGQVRNNSFKCVLSKKCKENKAKWTMLRVCSEPRKYDVFFYWAVSSVVGQVRNNSFKCVLSKKNARKIKQHGQCWECACCFIFLAFFFDKTHLKLLFRTWPTTELTAQ